MQLSMIDLKLLGTTRNRGKRNQCLSLKLFMQKAPREVSGFKVPVHGRMSTNKPPIHTKTSVGRLARTSWPSWSFHLYTFCRDDNSRYSRMCRCGMQATSSGFSVPHDTRGTTRCRVMYAPTRWSIWHQQNPDKYK